MGTKREVSLGVFTFERATKNTKRFAREIDNGRSEVQYVQKSVLAELGDPDAIEIVVRIADEE
jgi:hypothetical protein